MTAVQLLEKTILEMVNNGADFGDDYPALMEHVRKTKEVEEEQLIDGILHALDEDGHTGIWKIKFAKNYYEKISS